MTQFATQPEGIVCRGSRYVVSGSCSGKECDPADPESCGADANDPPLCSNGDTQIGAVSVSCCGSHMFGDVCADGKGVSKHRACSVNNGCSHYVTGLYTGSTTCDSGGVTTPYFPACQSCQHKGENPDCWVPYMQNQANECVAYDPLQAGWIDTTKGMGQRLTRSNTDVNLPYAPGSGRRNLATPGSHGVGLMVNPSDLPLGAMIMIFVGAILMVAGHKRVRAHVREQHIIF